MRDQSARLVTNIFPEFSKAIEEILRKSIQSGDRDHIQFALDLLGQYEGDLSIHPICKDIVNLLPLEDDLLTPLQIVLWNTGVLAGEFGHVFSLKEKRTTMEEWLSDDREKVRLFARDVIYDYEKEITSEQQRAENDSEMRKLRYEELENGASDAPAT
jgi:hypothetical protein